MKKIIISSILVVLWMIMIFILSGMNSVESNNKSKEIIGNFIGEKEIKDSDIKVWNEVNEENLDNMNFIFRKIAHAMVYLVLSFFTCNFFYQLKKRRFKNNYLISIIICLFYAIFDEYHQTFVAGRNGNYQDVLIDLVGAIIGSIVFYMVVKVIKNSKKTHLLNT